jgi:outer membrane receptor protein involved in Fe transport
MFQSFGGARSSKRRLFVGLAAGAILSATSAAAEGERHLVHIPAEPLDKALLTLASQTHEQLLYAPDLVAGRRVAALTGTLTVDEALARLLAHSGISVRRAGPEVVVLEKTASDATGGPPAQGPANLAGPASRPFAAEAAPIATAGPQPTADASAPRLPATTVEELEVTGSHIRGAPSASPLLVITAEDLQRSGQTTLAGALQVLPQNFAGGASEANTNTGGDRVSRNANFSSAVNLRGLGNNATLVLVNGRRMAGSGTFGDFADLSLIPTSAVARVEVLLDGASAVYGSDAVAGVVNIILKKDIDGAETRLEGGAATEGQPTEWQISQLLGRTWAGGGLTFAYEHQDRSALPSADRDFAASADLRPFGGSDQRQIYAFPGEILVGGAPAFAIPGGQNGVGLTPGSLLPGVANKENQRLNLDLLPRQQLDALYLTADQDVGERLEVSGDLRYSRRRYRAEAGEPFTILTVNRANPYFVSPAGGTSDSIAYSFAGDLPPSVQSGEVETLGLTFGGTYRLAGDWRAEAYGTYGRDKEDNRTDGLVNAANLSEALGASADNPATPFSAARDGYFNPFSGIAGSNAPAVLAFIGSGFSTNHILSHVSSASLQADGSLFRLPGGAVRLAAGVQARRETLEVNGTNFLSTVAPVPQGAADVSREVTAAFAELRAPFVDTANARPGLQRLELSVAGRIERYDDAGTTSNPKVGLVWSPAKGVELRATYGTSFRAPALRELHDTTTNVPLSLPAGATRIESLLEVGANPDLKPETATSWTATLDLRPASVPGLSADLTWFDIRYQDRIDKPVQQNLSGALTDPRLASFVTRISPTTNPADLALITALLASPSTSTVGGVFPPTAFGAIVDDRYVNTGALHVRGLDLTGAYALDLAASRLIFGLNATYTLDYDQQVTPTSPIVNLVNVAGFPVRFRSRLSADWTRDRLSLGGAFNYIGAYRDAAGARIGDQPTFDLQVRLAPAQSGTLKGVTAILGVRNVLDRQPPFYNNVFGVAYDPTNADPVGRFVSFQLIRAW